MSGEHDLRVLVVLYDDLFARNYLTTPVLDGLRRETDLRIVASDAIRTKDVVERDPAFRGRFKSDPKTDRRHFHLFDVLMWRNRRRSSSFRFRVRRHLGYEYIHHLLSGDRVGARLGSLGRFVKFHMLRFSSWGIALLGSRLLAPVAVPRLIRRVPVNPDLRRAVLEAEPDIVVFPSSAYDPTGNDLARICAEEGIRSLFLVDNWDNMSSKSVYWARPDHVAVWGPQSVEQAVEIQDFKPERVHVIGTPRFDEYFKLRDREAPSPFPFDYALFTGCALPFDEVSALEAIERELLANPDRYGDLRVVYRPHPWRQGRLRERPFDETRFERVLLDPQMAGETPAGGRRIPPGLEYYGPLLANARFVIAPLTTMLIEALIFDKPVVVLAYDDGVHYASPSRALANYEHFWGLDRVSRLSFAHSLNGVPAAVADAHSAAAVARRDQTDEQIGYFLHIEERPYAQRLLDLTLEVAGRPHYLRAGATGDG